MMSDRHNLKHKLNASGLINSSSDHDGGGEGERKRQKIDGCAPLMGQRRDNDDRRERPVVPRNIFSSSDNTRNNDDFRNFGKSSSLAASTTTTLIVVTGFESWWNEQQSQNFFLACLEKNGVALQGCPIVTRCQIDLRSYQALIELRCPYETRNKLLDLKTLSSANSQGIRLQVWPTSSVASFHQRQQHSKQQQERERLQQGSAGHRRPHPTNGSNNEKSMALEINKKVQSQTDRCREQQAKRHNNFALWEKQATKSAALLNMIERNNKEDGKPSASMNADLFNISKDSRDPKQQEAISSVSAGAIAKKQLPDDKGVRAEGQTVTTLNTTKKTTNINGFAFIAKSNSTSADVADMTESVKAARLQDSTTSMEANVDEKCIQISKIPPISEVTEDDCICGPYIRLWHMCAAGLTKKSIKAELCNLMSWDETTSPILQTYRDRIVPSWVIRLSCDQEKIMEIRRNIHRMKNGWYVYGLDDPKSSQMTREIAKPGGIDTEYDDSIVHVAKPGKNVKKSKTRQRVMKKREALMNGDTWWFRDEECISGKRIMIWPADLEFWCVSGKSVLEDLNKTTTKRYSSPKPLWLVTNRADDAVTENCNPSSFIVECCKLKDSGAFVIEVVDAKSATTLKEFIRSIKPGWVVYPDVCHRLDQDSSSRNQLEEEEQKHQFVYCQNGLVGKGVTYLPKSNDAGLEDDRRKSMSPVTIYIRPSFDNGSNQGYGDDTASASFIQARLIGFLNLSMSPQDNETAVMKIDDGTCRYCFRRNGTPVTARGILDATKLDSCWSVQVSCKVIASKLLNILDAKENWLASWSKIDSNESACKDASEGAAPAKPPHQARKSDEKTETVVLAHGIECHAVNTTNMLFGLDSSCMKPRDSEADKILKTSTQNSEKQLRDTVQVLHEELRIEKRKRETAEEANKVIISRLQEDLEIEAKKRISAWNTLLESKKALVKAERELRQKLQEEQKKVKYLRQRLGEDGSMLTFNDHEMQTRYISLKKERDELKSQADSLRLKWRVGNQGAQRYADDLDRERKQRKLIEQELNQKLEQLQACTLELENASKHLQKLQGSANSLGQQLDVVKGQLQDANTRAASAKAALAMNEAKLHQIHADWQSQYLDLEDMKDKLMAKEHELERERSIRAELSNDSIAELAS